MRYAIVMRAKSNLTFTAAVARRVDWNYPDGLQVEAEYWPFSTDPAVFVVAQAEDPSALLAVIAAWDDLFTITISACLSADEGLALARRETA